MLNDLLFSLDRVMPFFLLILLGYLLKRWNFLPGTFLQSLNKFVYRLALPLSLFSTVVSADDAGQNNGSFMFTAFLLITVSYTVIWAVTELLYKDKRLIGTLVQGSFRGNFALLGVPLATSVVGAEAAAPAAMAMAVVIPCYNCYSILTLVSRGVGGEKVTLKKVAVGIITTPLLVALLVGIVVNTLKIPIPSMAMQTVDYIGATATPLGLLSIGGLFNLEAATSRLKPSIYASVIKLVLMPAAVVALCYALGFRGTELFLFFIMFGAPVAVSSYAMATELGGDGPLASNILIVTTFFSSVTLSAGIYVMRSLGWI